MNRLFQNGGALTKGSVFFIHTGRMFILACLITAFLLFARGMYPLYSQSVSENNDVADNGRNSAGYSSTNFDGRMLAGLNGDSMFSLSMTQGLNRFAYQLKSNLSNNNDFDDYNNTSFIKNETGFTGEISVSDYWKLIPEFEIANSSFGMYDNEYFSRENKDKIRTRIKSEYKPGPDRWDIDISYARYDHGLLEKNTSLEKGDTFHTVKGVAGVEYIWSASNKVGFRSENGINSYPEMYEDDSYSYNEVYVSFKVTEYTMLTLTPMLLWNKDETDYAYFKGNISSINLKYISLELLYEYKLETYRPEDVIYSQKYMSGLYDLPPATIHHTEIATDFDVDTDASEDSLFAVRRAGLKLRGVYEDNNNFYNYYPLPENILSAEAVPVNYFSGRAEFVTTLVLFTLLIDMEFIYEQYRYIPDEPYSDINIAYRPEKTFTFNISYEGSWLEINWSNSYRSEVYISPYEDRRLGKSLLGTLDIHLKMYDTIYLHSRIINIYNEEYNYRDGYPEPGIQYFMGLRVII